MDAQKCLVNTKLEIPIYTSIMYLYSVLILAVLMYIICGKITKATKIFVTQIFLGKISQKWMDDARVNNLFCVKYGDYIYNGF